MGLSSYIIFCMPKAKHKVGRWSRPRYRYAKLNVDAGFDMDTLEGPVGGVLCDHHDTLIAATNKKK